MGRRVNNPILFAIACFLTACSNEISKTPLVYPEPNSAGARLLKEKCTGCHVPPLPSAHAAEEWSSVVFRMQNHRITRGLGPIGDSERQQLVAYLKKYAGGKQ